MKIICIKGGLGNQMFEYCRYRQHKDKRKERVLLYIDHRRMKEHGGCQLHKCFNIEREKLSLNVLLITLFIKLCRSVGVLKRLYDDADEERVTLIDDFSQDKRFIVNSKSVFHFRPLAANSISAKMENMIKSEENAVAVHFRRGDYMHPNNINYFGVCPLSYYEKAVERVLEVIPKAHFFIFSDDIEWVRANFKCANQPRITYIEHNPSEPNYTDMYLMTLCRGHIIANSTFSFWGAYLSERSKITIYPDRWFADETWRKPDIFPSNWIKI